MLVEEWEKHMARPKKDHHETAELILQCAREIFLEKGFDGTSINDIADTASIHKSLIYHHFGSKENLWKAVKERIIDKTTNLSAGSLSFLCSSLRVFLESYVTFRYKLYAQNPDIVRMMAWQKLETRSNAILGTSKAKLTDVKEEIERLQKMGQIRQDLKPDVVGYLITSMASSGFIDKAPFLKTKKGQDEYLRVIIEALLKILSPIP
jgi:TetR/AcrR family transcriptional regulator